MLSLLFTQRHSADPYGIKPLSTVVTYVCMSLMVVTYMYPGQSERSGVIQSPEWIFYPRY
jgi:hypothetical protein